MNKIPMRHTSRLIGLVQPVSMRFAFTLAILVALYAIVSLANPVQDYKTGDKKFLEKQKNILRLFKYINQPSYFKDHIDIYKGYSLESNYESFTKPEVAKYFFKYYTYGLLPKGAVFSVFQDAHLKEAIALFKLFYYAKDFETFYKTAVWARHYTNEGLYLYALSVAIAQRPDTYGIILPPIYEIYPYYFFGSDVIYQAQKFKQYHSGGKADHDSHTINSNYSGYYLNLNPEQSLSYYLEDVGINSFYYYVNIYYPFWLTGEEFKFDTHKRGENYYYLHQQLLARYYLERLSNDFGEIEYFNWEDPFVNGYYPSLTYPNGLEFPSRPNYAKLSEYFYNYGQRWTFKNKYGYSYTYVKEFEHRFLESVDSGFVFTKDGKLESLYTENGFNILGNLLEGNADSIHRKYYGSYTTFARHLLGYSIQGLDKYKSAPSALEHFETSLRDPAFYQLYKKVILFFQKYKFNEPAYTEKELYFPGVSVKKVEFDRLITYFDSFYSDVSSAVFVTPEEFEHDTFNVRVRQYRLNHKPFTYKVYASSDKDQESVVRIYIGPKYDEYGRYINISENRFNFVEFDHFTYKLKAGENVIERNSRSNQFYAQDRTTYKELYQKVLGAYGGDGQFDFHGKESYSYPLRYLLPKGSYGGFEYQFYVIVSPFVPHTTSDHQTDQKTPYLFNDIHLDGYTSGFPFDRPIEFENFFVHVPNSYFYSTKIYHRNADDINASTAVH